MLVAAACIFMGTCAWLADPLWERAFRSDNSPISWLSSAQLWGLSLISLRLGTDRSLPRADALWLCAAMAGLAMDEQFMLHEQWKYGCQDWTGLCRHAWARELPMLVVAGCGLATMLWLHRRLGPGLPRRLLWAAVGIGVWAIALDQLPMPAEIAVFEEGFEVLAETLFLGTLLGLRGPAR